MTSTNNLIKELKENNADFEWYPTTKEIIKSIADHMSLNGIARYGKNTLLDIGCGDCRFRTLLNESLDGEITTEEYYVIEKSPVFLHRLDKDIMVLGTDFYHTTLIDKRVNIIFCNPPYSEYDQWMKRIIFEGFAEHMYLVVPKRWKENKDILSTIEKAKADYKVIGEFNFFNADRQARATVDIVYISKDFNRHSEINPAFDAFFDSTFPMQDKNCKSDYAKEMDKAESIRQELVGGSNVAERLVKLYQAEQEKLFKHFQAITALDTDILDEMKIDKSAIKGIIKQRITGLKTLYWKMCFENLSQITELLTKESRQKLLDKFTKANVVDFTYDNVYATVIWVIKNANTFYNDQLVDFFKKLSSSDNVRPFKSNEKTFGKEKWRYCNDNKHSHYVLDYRIISSRFSFTSGYWDKTLSQHVVEDKMNDFCVIANNLGFKTWRKEIATEFGKKYNVYLEDGSILFEYKIYQNENLHLKLNKEFIKSINVEVSRLLGWVKCKEDIQEEFPDDMKGAEKYFKTNKYLQLDGNGLKLIGMNKGAEI